MGTTAEIEPTIPAQALAPAVAVPLPRPLVRPLALRASAGPLALAGLVVSGGAIALGAAGTRYLVLSGYGAPLPGWVVGPFAGIGWYVAGPVLCVLLAGMLGCYLVALRAADTLPVRWAIGAVVALHAVFLLAPPLLSSDVFNYVDASRLDALYGLDPYLATPLARTADIAFPFTGAAWTHSPSVYGPGFSLLSAALAPLGVVVQLWTLKALAALASLGCTALIWACARQLGRRPLHAALFWGLNPIVLVLAVGGAHNDLLMVVLALLALLLALRERAQLAVATLTVAVAVKLTALLLVPFVVIGSGPRARRAALTAIGALALLAAGTVALYGTAPLGVTSTLGAGAARHVGELRSMPGFVAGYAGVGPIGQLGRGVLSTICLVAIALLVWRAARGRLPWLTAACWATLALLLSSTRLEPWYAVWLIPLAALSSDRRVRAASHALVLAIAFVGLVRFALRLGIHYPHGG
jgi:alpha-1,6-mannosyltransferase